MPIKYKIVKQCEPGIKGGGESRYYARACSRQMRTLPELCEMISDRTTLSRADVVAVIASFTEIIPELLKNGYSVDLGSLGIMSVSIKSKGEKSEREVKRRSISGVQINFRPSVEIKRELKDVSFERDQRSKRQNNNAKPVQK